MATPTADMIARLRRMTAEPITSDTYTQGELSDMIARYPVPDATGLAPTTTLWAGAWDLNRAAADVWDEKASLLAADFDFAADGGDYKRSQGHAQMLAMANRYRSMRQTSALVLVATPAPEAAPGLDEWLGNVPEDDD
jgi:hypothetical protein